jgi:hypothetical protein
MLESARITTNKQGLHDYISSIRLLAIHSFQLELVGFKYERDPSNRQTFSAAILVHPTGILVRRSWATSFSSNVSFAPNHQIRITSC